MTRPLRRIAPVIAAALLLVACGAREPQYKLVKLPSGKSVKVLSVMKMQFTQGEPALMLKYETDRPISDIAALEMEVDEIWRSFQIDVEKAQLNNAIISATSHSSAGVVSRSEGHNFVFQKSANGTWQRLPSK